MEPICDPLMTARPGQQALGPTQWWAGSIISLSQKSKHTAPMKEGDVLRAQASQISAEVTLGWLTHFAGAVVPGLLLVLTALPSVLPLPGVGNLTGTALILMAWAIWRGGRPLALPSRLAEVKVSAGQASRLLCLLAWVHDRASAHLRPRVHGCVGPRSWVWSALPVALMGMVIFLPIPLGNVVGTVALVCLGLGHSLEDGLAVVAGWVLSGATLLYSMGVSWGLMAFAQSLWEWAMASAAAG